MSEIFFDDETHRYWRDISGQRHFIPNVGKILTYAGLKPAMSPFIKPYYLERGRLAHKAIEDFNASGVKLNNEFRVYVEIWEKFLEFEGFKITDQERIIYNAIPEFAGKMDAVGKKNGVEYFMELKTGKPAKWHQYQIAAYAYPSTARRIMLIYINPNSRREYTPVYFDLYEQNLLFREVEAAAYKYWDDHVF